MSIQSQIEQARTQLLYVQPFYALMLQKCRVSLIEEVKTAGVRALPTGQIELAIAPSFFSSLSEDHRIGLLQHEMLHLFMNHIHRGKALEKRTANIAMDMAINQFIDKKFLPPKAILPEGHKLPTGREFEFYYAELLKQEEEKKNQPQKGQGQGQSQSQQDSEGQSQEQESQGQAQNGQSLQDKSQGKPQDGGQGGDDGEILDNHEWGDAHGSSSEVQDLAVEQMLKEAAEEMKRRFAGKTPAHIEKLLSQAISAPAKVNWKRELKKYFGRHVSQDKESTRTRPNRRMGFKAQGSKREYTPKVTIAFDQSGSMGSAEVNAAFNEIRGLLKNQEDSTEIVYFDTAIAKTETLRKTSELKGNRYAHGGTDFNCVVEHLVKAHSDLCVILTDGEAPQPNKSKTPILWVIVGSKTCRLEGPKIFVDLQ